MHAAAAFIPRDNGLSSRSLGVTEVTLLLEAAPSAACPAPERQRGDKESPRSHGKLRQAVYFELAWARLSCEPRSLLLVRRHGMSWTSCLWRTGQGSETAPSTGGEPRQQQLALTGVRTFPPRRSTQNRRVALQAAASPRFPPERPWPDGKDLE